LGNQHWQVDASSDSDSTKSIIIIKTINWQAVATTSLCSKGVGNRKQVVTVEEKFY